MSIMDVAYHMRDHTPRWLMRLNLGAFVVLLVPILMTNWWPAWAAWFLLMAFNWMVGFRSFKQKQRNGGVR